MLSCYSTQTSVFTSITINLDGSTRRYMKMKKRKKSVFSGPG